VAQSTKVRLMVEATKTPIVNRPEYIIYLEYFNEMYWLHTDVFKWSSEVKKKYLKELDTLQSLLNTTMYGLVEKENIKLGKFGETIGFTYLRDLQGNDSILYKIYTRSL
jgi:hypothetical protein